MLFACTHAEQVPGTGTCMLALGRPPMPGNVCTGRIIGSLAGHDRLPSLQQLIDTLPQVDIGADSVDATVEDLGAAILDQAGPPKHSQTLWCLRVHRWSWCLRWTRAQAAWTRSWRTWARACTTSRTQRWRLGPTPSRCGAQTTHISRWDATLPSNAVQRHCQPKLRRSPTCAERVVTRGGLLRCPVPDAYPRPAGLT